MKLLTIVGARPQFIKAAAISREIKKYDQIHEIIVHTGQHFDQNMSNIFFDEMQIPHPQYSLEINSLNHGAMTGRMLEKIEEIVIAEKPDFVIVYGDTNSTLAGALAAKKLHTKVAHIEAGLRSFNMQMPEEINRILTDRISDILLCPTQQAIKNLKKEGFDSFNTKIINSGDVMQDTALFYSKFEKKPCFDIPQNFILATIHRAENTDDLVKLKNIFASFSEISKKINVIIPIHPRTKKILDKNAIDVSNLTIVEPLGYLEMIFLLKRCKMVMTDSGGLQKEAFFFHKPCVTLREETEWVELVENGFNYIAGSDTQKIIGSVDLLINKENDFSINLYGNGLASKNIVNNIINY